MDTRPEKYSNNPTKLIQARDETRFMKSKGNVAIAQIEAMMPWLHLSNPRRTSSVNFVSNIKMITLRNKPRNTINSVTAPPARGQAVLHTST